VPGSPRRARAIAPTSKASNERALDLLAERERLLQQAQAAIAGGAQPALAPLEVAERLAGISTELPVALEVT
jgi:hypothetical protein